MRAAVYVQYFTSPERGFLRQEQNCIYDFLDFTHPADRVQPFEKLIGLGFMHRSFDSAQRDGVYTNAILGILNGQCASHRIQTALSPDFNRSQSTRDRLPNKHSYFIDVS